MLPKISQTTRNQIQKRSIERKTQEINPIPQSKGSNQSKNKTKKPNKGERTNQQKRTQSRSRNRRSWSKHQRSFPIHHRPWSGASSHPHKPEHRPAPFPPMDHSYRTIPRSEGCCSDPPPSHGTPAGPPSSPATAFLAQTLTLATSFPQFSSFFLFPFWPPSFLDNSQN